MLAAVFVGDPPAPGLFNLVATARNDGGESSSAPMLFSYEPQLAPAPKIAYWVPASGIINGTLDAANLGNITFVVDYGYDATGRNCPTASCHTGDILMLFSPTAALSNYSEPLAVQAQQIPQLLVTGAGRWNYTFDQEFLMNNGYAGRSCIDRGSFEIVPIQLTPAGAISGLEGVATQIACMISYG
jgi:hypothetical protein